MDRQIKVLLSDGYGFDSYLEDEENVRWLEEIERDVIQVKKLSESYSPQCYYTGFTRKGGELDIIRPCGFGYIYLLQA